MSNRRNRSQRNRKHKVNLDFMTNEKFWMIVCLLLILIALFFFGYKAINRIDNKNSEKEKEEIDKQVNNLYSSVINSMDEVDNYKTDKLIRLSAIGNILCNKDIKRTKDNYNSMKQLCKDSDLIVTNLKNMDFVYYSIFREKTLNLRTMASYSVIDNMIGGDPTYEMFGANKENAEGRISTVFVKNTNIALLGYSTSDDNMNRYSEERVNEDVEYAKQSTELIIAAINWNSNDNKKEIANNLINKGVKVILGYDSDSIESYELIKNSDGEDCFVGYSMGNFDSINSTELMFNIQIFVGKNTKSNIHKVEYKPIYLKEIDSNYDVIDVEEKIKEYEDNKSEISENEYNSLLKRRKEIENKMNN